MAAREDIVLGIDLGTSNICVAIYRNGTFETIADGNGHKITPSYVAFNDDGRAFGKQAKKECFANPKNTLHSLKRIIGKRMNDPEVTENAARWPFRVVDFEGQAAVQITENDMVRILTPEDVASMLLRYVKTFAEEYLSVPITQAVLRIINEPTAAALAYGLHRIGSETLMVVDFGGGTLDVSILKITDGQSFQVLTTSGDMRLGGDDFDERILQHFRTEFETTHKVSLKDHAEALSKLRQEAELAKLAIAGGSDKYRVAIPYLDGRRNFHSGITAVQFNTICEDLFARVAGPVREALLQCEMQPGEISQIVMVGGSSRLPQVEHVLRQIFPDQVIHRDINPDEAIACGAAVFGHTLSANNVNKLAVVEVVPRALGTDVVGGWMATVVQKNAVIPCRESRIFTTSYNNCPTVHFGVYEGDARKVVDNRLLDEMVLTGITRGPAGTPRIEVTFDYDRDGILKVTAMDLDTNSAADGFREDPNKGR
ncbi:Major heat shock 70 kDa protein Ba [Hypsibius exemplaris]|uniref:Major heat shock 70 kDa protein Ba n=1 Tax=Hypsibius exemplaris TaxID=2072580 RepID=A0A9X6RND9_HYPEX|nr:Major heat shock 70 kDa protein Ba [Hypsibius exemplaris]